MLIFCRFVNMCFFSLPHCFCLSHRHKDIFARIERYTYFAVMIRLLFGCLGPRSFAWKTNGAHTRQRNGLARFESVCNGVYHQLQSHAHLCLVHGSVLARRFHESVHSEPPAGLDRCAVAVFLCGRVKRLRFSQFQCKSYINILFVVTYSIIIVWVCPYLWAMYGNIYPLGIGIPILRLR